MAKYRYDILPLEIADNPKAKVLSVADAELINSYEIKNVFNTTQANVRLDITNLEGDLITTEEYFKDYSLLGNAQSAGEAGASTLTIDIERDIDKYGFQGGDVRLLYSFTNNLFSESQFGGQFFIESISSDRTEFRALASNIPDAKVEEYANKIIAELKASSYFSEFKIQFGENTSVLGLNLGVEKLPQGIAIFLKSYEPLPGSVSVKDTFTVNEIVSDDQLFEVRSSLIDEVVKVPYLKGPNFNLELPEMDSNPTEFLNYNELFSYPVENSYFELYSLFNEKSAQITIDHTDFSDFINFSSAEERLRNFKYKLELIESYEQLKVLRSQTPGSTYAAGASGSIEHYDTLIKGIVTNFDHYDRFLYFESGSHAWPKSTTKKPHLNIVSDTLQAETWFNRKVAEANNYDVSNFDILTNTIPTFIREDKNNEAYLMFIHMIGQHFDNMWVYFKAVSDKYDADNRLKFGVSKDLVRSAVESFGVNLYSSNMNMDNIFASFIGETPETGSEIITTMSIATSASYNSGSTALEHLQPIAKLDYEKEIHKRIYHNLPYLIKTKGTERGLRALINCFGITPEILSIKTFGGVNLSETQYFGPESYTTSSSELKIRTDNTGSIVTGSTLSKFVSIVRPDKTYTDDLHHVEVGFNISRGTDDFIDLKTGKLNESGSFDLDDYIGDPRTRYERNYPPLKKLAEDIVNSGYFWEDIQKDWEKADWEWQHRLEYSRHPKAFVRLLNFFDSSLFKIIKDFVPARTKVDTGIIIKGHKLSRNKIKQVEVGVIESIETGSIKIGSATGSSGGAYDLSSSYDYTTNYNRTIGTPTGLAEYDITAEEPQYNGELSGSFIVTTDGELGKLNPYLALVQPDLTFDITVFNLSLPLPPACLISLNAHYEGEFYGFTTGGTGTGTVSLIYPPAVVRDYWTIPPLAPRTGTAEWWEEVDEIGNSEDLAEKHAQQMKDWEQIIRQEIEDDMAQYTDVTSFDYIHEFNEYEYVVVEATGVYGYYGGFVGWFDQDDTLVTTSNRLTIYNNTEDTYGYRYTAKFI